MLKIKKICLMKITRKFYKCKLLGGNALVTYEPPFNASKAEVYTPFGTA